jgi:hypothetical protein
MNLTKKTYLSTAMAAAMAGIGAPTYVGAVTLSQDLIGDVGIVPYYTMRDGWATDFNIVNTGNNTVAAKVRFHEGRNSREVLDFIVVLSPYDQINFFAVEDPVLGPVVRFPAGNSERTCVVPIPDGRMPEEDGVGGTLPFSAFDYTGANADGYVSYDKANPIDRVREGYMTVIEMGVSREWDNTAKARPESVPVAENDYFVGRLSNHNAPQFNCVEVENAFRVENIKGVYDEFERNQNNLKVGYSLTNAARGSQGSDSATMLANFATERSSIAHTATSILAGGTNFQAAVANLTAAGNVLTAAEAEVDRLEDVGFALVPPCDLATAPLTCPVPLQTSYTAALLAVTNAQIAVAAAQVAVDAATPGILGAPRNLIAPQEGSALAFFDYERDPNLDSGDFFAYWFADGFYRDFDNYGVLPDSLNLPFGLWAGFYPRSVDAVTALLMKSDAINTWALNENTGSSSDLVYTAPTKRFYTDWKDVYAKDPHLNGISPILASIVANSSAGWPPFGEQFDPTGQSCDLVGVAMYNNDEIGPKDPVIPSPSPNVSFCWEVNVLHTAAQSVLGSKLGERINPNILNAANPEEKYNGWIDVLMWVNAHNYHPALPVLNLTLPNIPATWPLDEIVQVGMPYIGFNFTERDLGNPANAYSGLTPHSYMRNWDKRNAAGGTITLEDLGLYGPVLLESIGSWFETNPITPIFNW